MAEEEGGPLVPRDELHAALEARRELGPDYERELVDAFADKLERRLEARFGNRTPVTRERDKELALAIVSLVVAIPLLGIAAGTVGLAGVVAVCAAIVLVNLLARF